MFSVLWGQPRYSQYLVNRQQREEERTSFPFTLLRVLSSVWHYRPLLVGTEKAPRFHTHFNVRVLKVVIRQLSDLKLNLKSLAQHHFLPELLSQTCPMAIE